MRSNVYVVGDYVSYLGDLTTLSEALRNPDIGRIDALEQNGERERIYLYLLTKAQHIWCDYENLRPIETSDAHLQKLGFQIITKDGRTIKYQGGPITLSRLSYFVPSEYYFMSGLCVGDFSKVTEYKKYLKDARVEAELLFSDFPSVENINDLFQFLRSMDVAFEDTNILK